MRTRMAMFHGAVGANLLLWIAMLGSVISSHSQPLMLGIAAPAAILAAFLQHWAYRNLMHPEAFGPQGPPSFTLDPRDRLS